MSELKSIFNHASNIRYRVLLKLNFSSGLRRSEAQKLKISEIDFINMKNLIHQGKGRKDRYVILSDHLLKELKTYCREFKPTDYLFYGNDKGRMMSDTGMNWILKKVAKKAGIKKHINIRSLRHFFACHHILLGTNLLVLKNLLGHQNIHSTTTYLQVTNQMESSVSNPLDIMYTDSGLIK